MKLRGLLIGMTCLGLVLAGCSKQAEPKEKNPIKGKFVVSALTGLSTGYVYVSENGEKKVVSNSHGYPVWSPDGSQIMARRSSDAKQIVIMDQNGEVFDSVNFENEVLPYDWFPDGKKIILAEEEENIGDKRDKISRVFIYDLNTKQKTFLHEFQLNQHVHSLGISPDGAKVAIEAGHTVFKQNAPETMGIMDIATGQIKELKPYASILGWFPDGKHIAISTNLKGDGSKFNQGYGILGKINVETGEFQIIKDRKGFYLESALSKDGKYFYYSKFIENNGMAIFVQSLDAYQEYQVTFPEKIGNTNSLAQDHFASWYQGG